MRAKLFSQDSSAWNIAATTPPGSLSWPPRATPPRRWRGSPAACSTLMRGPKLACFNQDLYRDLDRLSSIGALSRPGGTKTALTLDEQVRGLAEQVYPCQNFL